MNDITKVFRHIARDILVYGLTGFFVIADLAYLDYVLFNASSYKYIQAISFWGGCVIVACFVIGHVVFALMYLFVERTKIERCVKKCFLGKDFNVDYKKEISVFKELPDIHEHFIERHTQLYLMRWNLSGGLFACAIVNQVIQFYFFYTVPLIIISFFFFYMGIGLYLLSLRTEKDCNDRIEEIYLNHRINNE